MIVKHVRLLKYHIKFYGATNAALRIVSPVLKRVGLFKNYSQRIPKILSTAFDNRFGVDTSGVIPVAELDLSENEKKEAHRYQPTSPSLLAALIEELVGNHSEYAFVDLGSGKGRTLLVAAEFPFRKVIGVELSNALSTIAANNINHSRSRSTKANDVKSLCVNALDFDFPEESIFLYMFNPFGLNIFRAVLRNLEQSLNKNPRAVVILYNNAFGKELLDQSPYFETVKLSSIAPQTFCAYRAISAPRNPN